MKKMPPRISKLVAVAVAVVGLTAFSSSTFAESVKADPLAAKGCIPKISKDQALEVMQKFHFHSFNARASEIRTLGTALFYIEKLNDGKPLSRAVADPSANYGYSFHDAHRNSHQASNEIRVNRNGTKHYGENVAQLVHELGHYIGNNGGYSAYYDAVEGHYCKVSTYSDDNFHEQFAEVFAAFVTRPALIKRSTSKACKKAYKFFSEVIFPDSEALVNKCIARQDGKPEPVEKSDKAKSKPATKPGTDVTSNAKPSKKVEFKPVPQHEEKAKKTPPKMTAKAEAKRAKAMPKSAGHKDHQKSSATKISSAKPKHTPKQKPDSKPKSSKTPVKSPAKIAAKSAAKHGHKKHVDGDSDISTEPEKLEQLPKTKPELKASETSARKPNVRSVTSPADKQDSSGGTVTELTEVKEGNKPSGKSLSAKPATAQKPRATQSPIPVVKSVAATQLPSAPKATSAKTSAETRVTPLPTPTATKPSANTDKINH